MSHARKSRFEAGFTMIELVVVFVLILVVALLSFPALQRMTNRGRIEGISQQTLGLMRLARLEAIKRSVPTRLVMNTAQNRIYVVADSDRDGVFDLATDPEITQAPLPKGVYFWGAEDVAPNGANAMFNFDDGNSCNPPGECSGLGWAEFRPDGSASEVGAVRFGDQRGNFLEVRVGTSATGRTEVRKWVNEAVPDAEGSKYRVQGAEGKAWQWF